MYKFLPSLRPLIRLPLLYGILGGVLGFALVVVLFYIGSHPFMVGIVLDFRIALFAVFMYFILRELRDSYFGGYLSFGHGLVATWLFSIVFAVIASGLIWSFGINVPEFVIKYQELATNQLQSMPAESVNEIGKETYDKIGAAIPNIRAVDLATRYFVQCFLISFFISIILSVILRRQPQIQP
jgi:hypothetical protein